MAVPAELETRLESLENHLRTENPVLLSAVQSFRKLDTISRRLGFLGDHESHATRIPWWPLVAILGTYSSGKSTFLNDFLGQAVQPTGNQAVDDRFSVLCFGKEQDVRVLPGVALDADPRFPFYKMSRAIEEISAGEGSRIDAYLQLKACSSEALRGKIFIDSPGFDADQQRTATLRITDRIIDLSDLVLVFFDARHPEPGTMQDTLAAPGGGDHPPDRFEQVPLRAEPDGSHGPGKQPGGHRGLMATGDGAEGADRRALLLHLQSPVSAVHHRG